MLATNKIALVILLNVCRADYKSNTRELKKNPYRVVFNSFEIPVLFVLFFFFGCSASK